MSVLRPRDGQGLQCCFEHQSPRAEGSGVNAGDTLRCLRILSPSGDGSVKTCHIFLTFLVCHSNGITESGVYMKGGY